MPAAKHMPPALRGWPLIGNFFEYRRDHLEVFRRGFRDLGPIFSLRLGPQKAVVLVGPELHRFYFSEADRTLSLPEVYRFVVPMFGEVLNAAGTKQRKGQLALLRNALDQSHIPGHLAVMQEETDNWLNSLGRQGQFELWESFERLAMCIASSALLGPEIREDVDELLPLFHDLANGMEFVLPPNLPLPRFRRRDRARTRLIEIVTPLIAHREIRPSQGEDFLQKLIDAKRSHQMATETVINMVLLTIFTGYISTAAQASWTLIQLLQAPDYLKGVQDELNAVHGDSEKLLLSRIHRCERLGWALKESMRMHPVMSHYARFNARSYEIGGFHVPQGWLTMLCPAVAHRLPEVFSEPDVYKPERFAGPDAEDRAHPYSMIGFGGGFYRCPGMHFGTYEIMVIVGQLLRRYCLELDEPEPKPDFDIGIIRPKSPCRVKYTLWREVGLQTVAGSSDSCR